MLFGRDSERAQIWALLEAARASKSGALVIRGEAGIGKSALLDDARERATDMHVLRAGGVESESELPFAGVHQLLRPALHLIDGLPGPQAAALNGALGLGVGGGEDRFLISVACLTLLSDLAERRPVLCLVDDVHWLDTPSADALLFVARRLGAEGIALLMAARDGDARNFDARDLPVLEIRGLDAEAAGAVVARAAGQTLASSVRDSLLETAGGNALALVELPAALTAGQLAGTEALPEALPLTRGVERLFLERVRLLPEPTQLLLLVVAADDSGLLTPVVRAAELLGVPAESLSAAETAGLVSARGVRLDVRHPLVRSAIYQAASSSERRAVHLALADAFSGELESDRRAWHRAAAALGPDSDVAAELESASERARRRSGHAAAAAALERASDLSPDRASAARRLVAAADAAWQAGQPGPAWVLLDRADSEVSEPMLRAQLDHLRGLIEFRRGSPAHAGAVLTAAAEAVVPHDPRKALEMLFDAANTGLDSGDYALVGQAGQRAAALRRGGDEDLTFLADLLVGVGSLVEGRTTEHVPLVLEVVARADHFEEPRWLVWAAVGAGAVGDLPRGAALLKRAAAVARASGAVDALTQVLLAVAVEGIVAGRYEVAAEAEEGLALAQDAGLENSASIYRAVLAWLAAVQGRDDDCSRLAIEAAEHARKTGLGLANSLAEWALALLDLGVGRADEAASRLGALAASPPGTSHPYIVLMSSPDLVEACVRIGRTYDAQAALAVIDGFAQPGAPTWALALAARCRALCTAGDGAINGFAEALTLHAGGRRRFDLARTELLFGEQLRRDRRRTEARDHLRAAMEAFGSLGAAPWAERARTELRATGEAARRRDPSTLDQLTSQELQVARFVSEGLTNKEVAAQLFLSPRTIDSHLRSVFSKLGVTSRTQLARLPLGGDSGPAETAAVSSV
jgi:DNA-binding CsgD family transcriptional regulator